MKSDREWFKFDDYKEPFTFTLLPRRKKYIICNEEKALKMGLRTPGDIRDNICYHCCPCGDCPCKYALFEDNTKMPYSDFNPEGHTYKGI